MKVGIDLGTTYSAVARYDRNANKPVMIPNAFGKEITPSVICFLDDGDILVGEDAKDMQSNGTGVNAAAFKRNMGDGSIAVSFNGKDYTSEDLSAMLLKHLIADAEKATGEKIDEAVITVPASPAASRSPRSSTSRPPPPSHTVTSTPPTRQSWSTTSEEGRSTSPS